MIRFPLLLVVATSCLVALASTALAQRAGQTSTIRHGTVVGLRNVDLNNADALKGALVGGAFGAALTSRSKSSSRRNRNAVIGAVIGGSSGAARRNPGRVYSVRTNDGTIVQVATEQTEIRMDDCVVVEESGGSANIRRASASACEASSQAIVADADIQSELQEEAAECVSAKQELIGADTDEAIDRAIRKIEFLCYN